MCDNVFQQITELKDNWNNNGANAFSETLIAKCKRLVSEFQIPPSIFPTADNSIQMEWDNVAGDYLEINVYDDKCIVFQRLHNGVFSEYEASEHELKNIVKIFFET